MDEPQPIKKQNKDIEIIATIALVAILVVALSAVAFNYIQLEQNPEKKLTSYYTNITCEEAYTLINTTKNLSVIDCRGLEGCSSCQFNKGHLPGAAMNSNPTTLYNTTNDILVYSKNGENGSKFCQDLINHVYGKIYNLEGGYNTWSIFIKPA